MQCHRNPGSDVGKQLRALVAANRLSGGTTFGADGYVKAWQDLRPTEHFVGSVSFRATIFASEDGDYVQFTLRNTSGWESFTNRTFKGWERNSYIGLPLGDVKQTYVWFEKK